MSYKDGVTFLIKPSDLTNVMDLDLQVITVSKNIEVAATLLTIIYTHWSMPRIRP
jgi:hypothetical protein